MTMSEFNLNADTFKWIERMPPILLEHEDIMSRSRQEAEEGLKASFIYISVCLSVCLSVCSFVCLFVCLFVNNNFDELCMHIDTKR